MGNFTNKHGGMEPAIFCVDGLYEYDPSTLALEILAEENQAQKRSLAGMHSPRMQSRNS